jgi:hypothetical protein
MAVEDHSNSRGPVIRETLLGIPSVFEQLIYVASLAAEPQADGAVAQHKAVFEEWLCLNLARKQADLEAHAKRQHQPALELIRHWIQPYYHESLIPRSALAPERELFEIELEMLLPIFASRKDASSYTGRS